MSEKQKSCGAIWLKSGKPNINGEPTHYLSLSLELNGQKMNFVAFVNDYKDSDNKPDYKIFEPRKQNA